MYFGERKAQISIKLPHTHGSELHEIDPNSKEILNSPDIPKGGFWFSDEREIHFITYKIIIIFIFY